jgi:PTH1 family peptidyl-tRNA hydrolase
MLLVVGLGNPGKEYVNTRHNVGFLVADELAKALGVNFTNKRSVQALVAQTTIGETRALLVKPQTFMNASGKAVAAVVSKNQIKPDKIIVVYDDADLKFGDVRFRLSGSSAGHKGMGSIQNALGKKVGLARVRVGIGRPPNSDIELDKFVLGAWTSAEKNALPEIISRSIEMIGAFAKNQSV